MANNVKGVVGSNKKSIYSQIKYATKMIITAEYDLPPITYRKKLPDVAQSEN